MSERDRKERLRASLSAGMEGQFQVDDDRLTELIDEAILRESEENYLPLGQRIRLRRELYDSFRRLDILQELVDDPDVTEIMVNGTERIFVEKKGQIFQWDRTFSSTEQLEDLIQQVVSRVVKYIYAAVENMRAAHIIRKRTPVCRILSYNCKLFFHSSYLGS